MVKIKGDSLELYFHDLSEEVQKALLEFMGIESPEEANWDVFPIDLFDKCDGKMISGVRETRVVRWPQ